MTVVPLRVERSSKTVFVLGGGGNLGAVQVGMLRALMEAGIVPDEIVGCSAGALNAAAVAADPSPYGVERLEEVWTTIDPERLCPAGRLSGLLLLTRKGRALHSNEGLRSLIEESLPFRRFEDATVPFHVVATSLRTGGARWFSEGDIVEPILASAALPAVFPPVEIDGELLIDGAVVDNVPVTKAVTLGADRVFVLHVGNFDRPRREPRRPIDVLLQSFSISRSARFAIDMANLPEHVEVTVLPGVDPGTLRYNDFTNSRRLIERAAASTRRFLTEERLALSC